MLLEPIKAGYEGGGGEIGHMQDPEMETPIQSGAETKIDADNAIATDATLTTSVVNSGAPEMLSARANTEAKAEAEADFNTEAEVEVESVGEGTNLTFLEMTEGAFGRKKPEEGLEPATELSGGVPGGTSRARSIWDARAEEVKVLHMLHNTAYTINRVVVIRILLFYVKWGYKHP